MKHFNLLLIALIQLFISCSNPEMMKTFPTEMVEATAVESQYFFIASEKDSIIIGNDGTGLVVGAHSFIDESGKAFEGTIKFELAEASKPKDLIGTHLSISGAIEGAF